jgi:hypothetical protein
MNNARTSMDHVRRAAWLLGLVAGCAADNPELRCGAGTALSAGSCVAPPPLGATGVAAEACGTGTHEADGYCLPDGPDVASTEACQGDPRVMHLDGDDFIYTGTLRLTEATWSDVSQPRRIYLLLDTGAPPQGEQWNLRFESRLLEYDLIPGTYEAAERAAFASPGHPGIDVSGAGRGCETSGRFQIHEIDQRADGYLHQLLLSFEQHCNNSSTQRLTGCVRFAR